MADDVSTPSDTPNPTAGTDIPAGAQLEPKPTDIAPVVAADPAPTGTPADPAAGDNTPTPEALGDWPADWRQKYSTDPKIVKQLERYASPKAALDALFAARLKISSGELKSTLKEGATPEEVATWRTDNGIPESADKYDLTLTNGLVVGEADKPMVDEFLAKAHATNMHPSQVKEALGWYFDRQEQARVAQEAKDSASRAGSEDALRAEYGTDYRRNVAIANQLLDGAPQGVKDQLLAGRLADGTPIGNSPDVIRWLVGMSRELNPIGTVVPGSGTNAVQAVEAEISSLRKMMGDNKSDYWKGPAAATNQARYLELTRAISQNKGR